MDIDRFTEGMNLLAAIYDQDAISEAKVEARFKAYLLVLGDLDGDAFVAACVWASRQEGRRFFPTPGELLAHRTATARYEIDQEDVERRRLRGDYYAAHDQECAARGTPWHREALARLHAAYAAYTGRDPAAVEPHPLLLEPGEPEGPAPQTPVGSAHSSPVPSPEQLRERIIDLADRRSVRGVPRREASGE